jgi:hypothetical protein
MPGGWLCQEGEKDMLQKIILIAITGFVILHGLVHLIGFRVYAQGVDMAEMPYKTTLLNGSLELGQQGAQVFGLLWLLPTAGFVLAGAGLFLGMNWWQPVMIASGVISLALTGLDWAYAFRGTLIDAAILGVMLLSPVISRLGFAV